VDGARVTFFTSCARESEKDGKKKNEIQRRRGVAEEGNQCGRSFEDFKNARARGKGGGYNSSSERARRREQRGRQSHNFVVHAAGDGRKETFPDAVSFFTAKQAGGGSPKTFP